MHTPRAIGLGVALVLSLSACGKPVNDQATVTAGNERNSLAPDCAQVWQETRNEVRASGQPDGEARRAADLARLECENKKAGPPGEEPTTPLLFPCASDDDQRNARPPPHPEVVGVYFACRSEPPGAEYPVYLQLRDAPSSRSELEDRVSFAVAEYLEGPTAEESERGYVGVLSKPLTGALDSVTIDGDRVEVSFDSSFEKEPGWFASTAGLFFLSVGATVFQFQDLNELELQVSGSCHRFWRLLEGICNTTTKEEWGL